MTKQHHAAMDFGKRLATIRKARKVSQETLASAVNPGSGQSWISNFETGKHFPGVPDIYRIAEYLKCHPGELFDNMPSPSQPVGFDDATMAQALELIYLVADTRPGDPMFQRPQWATIQVAAKAITLAEGNVGKAVARFLEEIRGD